MSQWKNLFQCNTELLALVQKRTTKSVRSVVIYHGLRLRMASHSVFKYKALVKRPTVAFSFFQAIQSRTILWTASLWVSVSADKVPLKKTAQLKRVSAQQIIRVLLQSSVLLAGNERSCRIISALIKSHSSSSGRWQSRLGCRNISARFYPLGISVKIQFFIPFSP